MNSNKDDDDNLSKRWQNLEKYADKQKSKKKKQFCKEYGSVFRETTKANAEIQEQMSESSQEEENKSNPEENQE